MAFAVDDFQELIRLLEQRPEWRAELRRFILTDELLRLPEIVRDLADAQRRAEERLAGVEDRLAGGEERLAGVEERLAGVEERLARLEDATTRLADAQTRTEQRLGDMAHAMERLAGAQTRMDQDLGRLKGIELERQYRDHGAAYFSRLARRTRVLADHEVAALVDDAVTKGLLSQEEADDLIQVDLIVRGRSRDDGEEVHLLVEVSWGVGVDDVVRAARRAGLLAKSGVTAVPVVAGDWITPDAMEPARAYKVWQVTDGRTVSPDGSV